MSAGWSVRAKGLPQELRDTLGHLFAIAEETARRLPLEKRSVSRQKAEMYDRLDFLLKYKIVRQCVVTISATTGPPMDGGYPGGSVISSVFEMPVK